MAKILRFNRRADSRRPLKSLTVSKALPTSLLLLCMLLVPLPSLGANDNFSPEPATDTSTKQLDLKLANGKRWMAVTANDHATSVAGQMLANGATAIDALIAAQMVLGLVEPQSSGIGGGGFLLYWDAGNKKLVSFDGRETAPMAVDEQHFRNEKGGTMPFMEAVIGGHAIGTPGLLHMLENAHQLYGKTPWTELFDPAIELSTQGFIISERLHQLLDYISRRPGSFQHQSFRSYFLDKNGAVKPIGQPLKNPGYANTLQLIAKHGSEVFYQGEIAQLMVDSINNDPVKPGKLSIQDLGKYKSLIREPLCHTVKNFRVCGSPPPSSGASTIIEILALMNHLPNAEGLSYNSTAFYHRFIEASKLAFANRNRFIADPAFVDIPFDKLLDDQRLQQRASLIPLREASQAPASAMNIETAFVTSESLELPSTSHLSIIDQYGNIASMTSSIETAFGSQHMVGGFLMNNQLTDFSFLPENEDGVVANRIQAGKRPRSSMAPMIILDNENNPLLVIGSPGGARIIPYVAKVLAQHLFHGASLEEAISSTHVSNLNTYTSIEKDLGNSQALQKALNSLGHDSRLKDQNSGIHAIRVRPWGYEGVADPRREGTARGN